jgi:hypothetical protein
MSHNRIVYAGESSCAAIQRAKAAKLSIIEFTPGKGAFFVNLPFFPGILGQKTCFFGHFLLKLLSKQYRIRQNQLYLGGEN